MTRRALNKIVLRTGSEEETEIKQARAARTKTSDFRRHKSTGSCCSKRLKSRGVCLQLEQII
jgi:hypothetical protein